MAFKPLFGTLATEDCEISGDFLVTGDIIVDGTVRMAPDMAYGYINEWGFYNIDWDYAVDFNLSGDIETFGWTTGDLTFIQQIDYNFWIPNLPYWPNSYVSVIGREQLTGQPGGFGTGEVHSIEYTGEEWAGVDNAEGWNIEFTFFMPVNPNSSVYFLHRGHPNLGAFAAQGGVWHLDFDDGTKRGRIWIDPWSAIFAPDAFDQKRSEIDTVVNMSLSGDPEAYNLYPYVTYYNWALSPRTLRITVKGDEVWITCNSGIEGSACYGTISPSMTGVFKAPSGNVHMGYFNPYIGNAATNLLLPSGPSIMAPLISSQSSGTGYVRLGAPPTDPTLQPGSPFGIGNSAVYDENGRAIGYYYLGKPPYPPNMRRPNDPSPSQQEPIRSSSYKWTFHLADAGLGTSTGTKKIGFYHSVSGETFDGMGNQAGVLMIDRFKVLTGAPRHEGYSYIVYSGDHMTYSPALQPVFPVEAWGEAIIETIDVADSGDTYIQPQYWESGDWQNLNGQVLITGDPQSIDLSAVPVTSDLEDKVRFGIRQLAYYPSGEPPRVDTIKVRLSQITGDFDLHPTYGPTEGGTEVTLSWQGGGGSFSDDQPVYVGTTQVPTGDVTHVDANTKIVTMPARTAGKYSVRVVGSDYWSVRPFTYYDQFDLTGEITAGVWDQDELELVFGKSRSPFRVHNKPTDQSVKLALVGSTPVDIDVHMSLVNLADREPANLTGYGVTEDHLYNGTSGDFTFTGAADTEDIMVSNRAAMWRDLDAPVPLFYKYLVGRDRYYVHVPAAADTGDIETIRSAIRVYEDGGVTNSFYWDIEASDTDYNGDALPTNVYSVVLFLSHVSQNTMWVSYRGADRLEDYEDAGIRRETINPVPLFDDGSGRMNFAVDYTVAGEYNVRVTV